MHVEGVTLNTSMHQHCVIAIAPPTGHRKSDKHHLINMTFTSEHALRRRHSPNCVYCEGPFIAACSFNLHLHILTFTAFRRNFCPKRLTISTFVTREKHDITVDGAKRNIETIVQPSYEDHNCCLSVSESRHRAVC